MVHLPAAERPPCPGFSPTSLRNCQPPSKKEDEDKSEILIDDGAVGLLDSDIEVCVRSSLADFPSSLFAERRDNRLAIRLRAIWIELVRAR